METTWLNASDAGLVEIRDRDGSDVVRVETRQRKVGDAATVVPCSSIVATLTVPTGVGANIGGVIRLCPCGSEVITDY